MLFRSLSFRRNIIDQDGESFAPWVPDAETHSLSWAVNYEQPVLEWLKVYIDAYNSLVLFRPTQTQWTNTIYLQSPVASTPTDLYNLNWTSRPFNAGLLENTIGLKAQQYIFTWFYIDAHLDFTLDAMLLGHGKSKVSPYAQAGLNLSFIDRKSVV